MEIRCISTGGQYYGAILLETLAFEFVLYTNNLVALSQTLCHTGLLENRCSLGGLLCDILQGLHEGIGDDHAGEHLLSSVCAGFGMASESGHERQIEIEDILQPFDGRGGFVGEHFDELGTGEVACGFERVVVEFLDIVGDSQSDLSAGQSAVDPGSRLCRVTAFTHQSDTGFTRDKLPKKGFLSRTRTLPPDCSTLCAALNPDKPPPTGRQQASLGGHIPIMTLAMLLRVREK